jgi:hypothetical protein
LSIAHKDYHHKLATAVGPKGQKDYSRWTFLILLKYTAIKEGVNKIASKISCDKKPSLVSYYTLNVTGLAGSVEVLVVVILMSLRQITLLLK